VRSDDKHCRPSLTKHRSVLLLIAYNIRFLFSDRITNEEAKPFGFWVFEKKLSVFPFSSPPYVWLGLVFKPRHRRHALTHTPGEHIIEMCSIDLRFVMSVLDLFLLLEFSSDRGIASARFLLLGFAFVACARATVFCYEEMTALTQLALRLRLVKKTCSISQYF